MSALPGGRISLPRRPRVGSGVGVGRCARNKENKRCERTKATASRVCGDGAEEKREGSVGCTAKDEENVATEDGEGYIERMRVKAKKG